MPQTVYCDEAGFSGNNLLDPAQPYFTFATLAIEAPAAAAVVAKAVEDFGLTGGELKGERLLRFSRGQKALLYILRETAPMARLSAWHKRYSLASKFFEYIFEPLVAPINSLFYNAGFHRYISNVIYHEALGENTDAAEALEAFQKAARVRTPDEVSLPFSQFPASVDASELMSEIAEFTVLQQRPILEELKGLKTDRPLDRWLLDLSVSSLSALLSEWSLQYDSLTVICDASKPLEQNREHFDMMVNRPEFSGTGNRPMLTLEGESHPIGFNLSGPVTFVSSHDHAGIQLADCLATALAYGLRHRGERWFKECFELISSSVSGSSVFPEVDRVDHSTRQGIVNRLILRELVNRSRKGADLLDGMPRFVEAANAFYAALESGDLPPPGARA